MPTARCQVPDCSEPVHYVCHWPIERPESLAYLRAIGREPRRCGARVCYFHGREVAENRAYCIDHWDSMRAERLAYVPEQTVQLADAHPDAFNARRPPRKVPFR